MNQKPAYPQQPGQVASGKPKHGKWDRADKINGIGVLIAILGLLLGVGVPNLLHWISYLNRPEVSFKWPRDNAKMTNNTFGASGTANNIPSDSDLWLMVKSGIEGRWYPVERLPVVNGTWNVSKDQICPTPGLQELVIYLVSDSEEGQLFAYERSAAAKKGAGINSVPLDSLVEATSYVLVPSNTRPFC